MSEVSEKKKRTPKVCASHPVEQQEKKKVGRPKGTIKEKKEPTKEEKLNMDIKRCDYNIKYYQNRKIKLSELNKNSEKNN